MMPAAPPETLMAAHRQPRNDRWIRVLTAASVLLVAGIAAVVSFTHIQQLAITHGQPPLAGILLPLSIDGTVAAASGVMLRGARFGPGVPWLARFMLGLAVAATLACNVGYGAAHGIAGALLSGWPAVAFIGCTEMVIGMVRKTRTAQTVRADQTAPVNLLNETADETGFVTAHETAHETGHGPRTEADPVTAHETVREPVMVSGHEPRPAALKLPQSKSRKMSAEQLAVHVSAMIGEYGDVSKARVQRDLHIGPDKARQALFIARGGHLPLRAVN